MTYTLHCTRRVLHYATLVTLAALTLSLCAVGQTVTFPIYVDDADGQTWNNGLFTATLENPASIGQNNFVLCSTKQPVTTTTVGGVLSATGTATITLTANNLICPVGTQWVFNITPQATPASSFTQNTTISTTTTTQIFNPPGIRVSVSNPTVRVTAYQDFEVTGANVGSLYFNLIGNAFHDCIAVSSGTPQTCTTWDTIGGSLSGGVQYSVAGSYAPGATQAFPSNLPNVTFSLGCTVGDISTTGPIAGMWCNIQGASGNPNIDWWDGNQSHTLVDQFWSVCLMIGGCTGVGATVATETQPQFFQPNVGQFYFNSGVGTPSNFDESYYYYNSNNTPAGFTAGTSYLPAVNYTQQYFSTNNNGEQWLGESDQPGAPIARRIASGTATMTSGSVSGASCQTAVSGGTATNVLATDTITWAYATAPTGTTDALLTIAPYVGSGAVHFTRCNPTAGSITGTAIVINWNVIR